MNIGKFMLKYADEAFAVSRALATMLNGLALSPSQTNSVNEAISKLETAHESIQAAVKAKPDNTVIKIAQKDIDAALARVLPKLVEKAVAEALAAKEKSDG